MGKGICADCYVGDRDAQINFARMFGGSGQLPIDIAASLRRPRRRKKKRSPRRAQNNLSRGGLSSSQYHSSPYFRREP